MCTSYQEGLDLGAQDVEDLVASLESGEKDLDAAYSRIRCLEDETSHAPELETKLAEADTAYQAKLDIAERNFSERLVEAEARHRLELSTATQEFHNKLARAEILHQADLDHAIKRYAVDREAHKLALHAKDVELDRIKDELAHLQIVSQFVLCYFRVSSLTLPFTLFYLEFSYDRDQAAPLLLIIMNSGPQDLLFFFK